VHLAGFSWVEMALCFVGLGCVHASTNKVVHGNNNSTRLYSGELRAKFAICWPLFSFFYLTISFPRSMLARKELGKSKQAIVENNSKRMLRLYVLMMMKIEFQSSNSEESVKYDRDDCCKH